MRKLPVFPLLLIGLACCKQNDGEEVANLIDVKAKCAARKEGTAVCRVNNVILLCSREGCQPIKYTLPPAESASGAGGPAK